MKTTRTALFYRYIIKDSCRISRVGEDSKKEIEAAARRMIIREIETFGFTDDFHVFEMNPYSGKVYYHKEIHFAFLDVMKEFNRVRNNCIFYEEENDRINFLKEVGALRGLAYALEVLGFNMIPALAPFIEKSNKITEEVH